MTGKWITMMLAASMAVAVPAALAQQGDEHPGDGETEAVGGVILTYESSAFQAAHRNITATPIGSRTPACMDCHAETGAANLISTQD